MSLVLTVLLTLAGLIPGIITLALVLPFSYQGQGRVRFRVPEEDPPTAGAGSYFSGHGRGRVRWAWGLVSFSFATASTTAGADRAAPTPTLAIAGMTIRIRPKGEEQSKRSTPARKAKATTGPIEAGAQDQGRGQDRKPGQGQGQGRRAKRRWRFQDVKPLLSRQMLRLVLSFLGRLFQALHLRGRVVGTYGTGDPALTGALAGLVGIISSSFRGGFTLDLAPDFEAAAGNLEGNLKGWLVPAQILALGLVFMWQPLIRNLWWPRLKAKMKMKKQIRLKEAA